MIRIKYPPLITMILATLAMTAIALYRLDLDSDLVRTLPAGDKAVADALRIFELHPIQGQLAIDITAGEENPAFLIRCGKQLEERLLASGLFAQVGTGDMAGLLPELALHSAGNLPMLFSKRELEEQVAPLLAGEQLRQRFESLITQLGSLEGMGQSAFIGQDPLGLKDLVLARLAPLAPTDKARIIQDSLLSSDGRHLLVTARPEGSSTDTVSARAIDDALNTAFEEIKQLHGPRGKNLVFTPVGAYRAALDNELIIRHDVRLALTLTTLGIALLLLLGFSRPLLGLLSLVPALFGTAAALFVYSLLHPSLSVMALGFGGAVISITVDHGIAYLLFFDRANPLQSHNASRETRAVGLMAVVTTVGAFLMLTISAFPVFRQLGVFTALGVVFSFLFVHCIFPAVFPSLSAPPRTTTPLQTVADRLYRTGRTGAWVMAGLTLILLFFARPHFQVSLEDMNTVRSATAHADRLFSQTWGDMGSRLVLMTSGPTMEELQKKNDLLLGCMEKDLATGVLASGFNPSMLFPGPERGSVNLRDWHAFWNQERVARFDADLKTLGNEFGFSDNAFSGFLALLSPGWSPDDTAIPPQLHGLLGIVHDTEQGGVHGFATAIPGPAYGSNAFSQGYADYALFDPAFFSDRLAHLLFSTFRSMLLLIAASVTLLIFFSTLSIPLTVLTMLPPVTATVCTLGTLHLLGRPLDIPALMLSVVILGMGVDYSIFFVRAHQRYREMDHPSYGLVRSVVFMAGTSTLIGFGSLCFAEHSLLRSIGITSLLGIGYSLLSSFLLLPPLLQWYFARPPGMDGKGANPAQKVRRRYRLLEPYPRFFAGIKLASDPMFRDLPRMLGHKKHGQMRTIADIGCGYGIPGCWCLEYCRASLVTGIDPDPERVRVASLALGDQGRVVNGWAPEMPPCAPGQADLILLLDMLHYLDEPTARELMRNCARLLAGDAILVARFAIQPKERPSWSWRLEDYRARRHGDVPCYHGQERLAWLMRESGLEVLVNEISPANPELAWLVASPAAEKVHDG